MADTSAAVARAVIRTSCPEQALAIALEELDGPLKRGLRDCCTGPCRAFGRLHGVDPLGPVTYRTMRGAWRFVRSYGGARGCAETIAARAGLVETDPAPGLIGRVIAPGREMELSLGLCIDGEWWATKGEDGVMFVTECEQCWGLEWA